MKPCNICGRPEIPGQHTCLPVFRVWSTMIDGPGARFAPVYAPDPESAAECWLEAKSQESGGNFGDKPIVVLVQHARWDKPIEVLVRCETIVRYHAIRRPS